MKRRRPSKIAAGIALASLGAALVVQACGGDSGSGGDGGPDATTSDVASNDVASNDVVTGDGGVGCPTYTGSSGVCKALVTKCQSCGSTLTSCDKANFTTECEGVTPLVSAAYIAAITACATQCDQDAAAACQKSALADASLTSAQQKIATDYCSACDGGAACPALVESSLNLVDLSDSLSATIDSKCTPDAAAACAPSKFGNCVIGTLLGSFPKVCADAGTD